MRAAPAAAELESFDCDHFDAGLAQRGVGADVALLSDDYAGSERNHIVAIVPCSRSAPKPSPPVWAFRAGESADDLEQHGSLPE